MLSQLLNWNKNYLFMVVFWPRTHYITLGGRVPPGPAVGAYSPFLLDHIARLIGGDRRERERKWEKGRINVKGRSPVFLLVVAALLWVYAIRNKMQSETADFNPMPPPGELDAIYESSLILALSLHYVKTRQHWQHLKHTKYCTAVRGGPSHGHR